MYDRPFLHEFQSASGERPFQDIEGGDLDRGLELAIPSMEVRRRMVIENIRIQIP